GIKEINEEISSKIESGCRINSPNIVILEPGPASNSNTAIFKSIDIYLNDLEQD
ncbi:46053_t:CDS:1, partial [Gigaspora margarita]